MKIYDKDIRKILYSEIVTKDEFVSDPTTIVVNELDVYFGLARIDVAVINGKMHGFEIKSERDNLERLHTQIEFYNKIFDTVTLVVSESHCSKVTDILPDWWGLSCVIKENNNVSIQKIKEPKQNHDIEPLGLTQLLWKDELHELLKLNGVTKGIKSKTRYELGKLVVQLIQKDEIGAFVRSKLKERKPWKALPLQQLYDELQQ